MVHVIKGMERGLNVTVQVTMSVAKTGVGGRRYLAEMKGGEGEGREGGVNGKAGGGRQLGGRRHLQWIGR